MRLVDSMRRKPQQTVVEPTRALFQSTYGMQGNESIQSTFQSFALDGYQTNSIVFAVILTRGMLFSEATFKWRNTITKKLFGNTDLALLENPWPGGTTGELLWRMEQDVSLAGNSFTARVNNRLLRLRPDCVTIVSQLVQDDATNSEYREVVGYLYQPYGSQSGVETFYPVEDVAHWSPIPDPLADFRGMSWLTPIVREINTDTAMSSHKQKFFENAATPNLILKYPQKIQNSETIDKISARFEGRYGGPDQAWKTVVLDDGADLTIVGNNFQQAQFGELQAAGENRIAAAGGVPSIIVGLKEGLNAATYSNYGQAMRRFADLTMSSQWRSAAACLSKLVATPDGAHLWYDTTDIPALRENATDSANTAFTLAKAAGELIRVGYKPETVADALTSADFTLLSHTGAIPTALYPNGKEPGPSEVMSPAP